MIHVTYGNNLIAYLSLEDQRINQSVDKDKIRYLFKFTNDLTKAIKYSYAESLTHNERYVKCEFIHDLNDDLYMYKINLKPYGYWKYEVYEVSWTGAVAISAGNAPINESDVLPVSGTHGIVQGKVEQGKLLVSETAGNEQVKYTQYAETTSNNYIYTN